MKPENGLAAGFDAGSAFDDAGGKLNSDFCPFWPAVDVVAVLGEKRLLVFALVAGCWLLVKENGAAAAVALVGVAEVVSLFG